MSTTELLNNSIKKVKKKKDLRLSSRIKRNRKMYIESYGCQMNLSDSVLKGANLSFYVKNKNLSDAIITNSDLSYTNLKGMKLTNVNFNGVNLSNSDLSYADLSNSIFTNVNLNNADLSNAILDGTEFNNTELNTADTTNVINSKKEFDNEIEFKELNSWLREFTEDKLFETVMRKLKI